MNTLQIKINKLINSFINSIPAPKFEIKHVQIALEKIDDNPQQQEHEEEIEAEPEPKLKKFETKPPPKKTLSKRRQRLDKKKTGI